MHRHEKPWGAGRWLLAAAVLAGGWWLFENGAELAEAGMYDVRSAIAEWTDEPKAGARAALSAVAHEDKVLFLSPAQAPADETCTAARAAGLEVGRICLTDAHGRICPVLRSGQEIGQCREVRP